MKLLVVLYKIAFALLVFVAVAVQLAHTVSSHGSIVNFFSFFTIESNIFAATMLLLSAVFVGNDVRSQIFDYWRGAAALYMVVTGVIYALLLRGTDAELYAWVNTVLHYIFPVVMLADWLLDRPRWPLSFKKALWWLAFPFAYLAYTLIRGPHANWYPYPFIDATQLSYGRIAVNCVGIAGGFVLITFLLTRSTRLRNMPQT